MDARQAALRALLTGESQLATADEARAAVSAAEHDRQARRSPLGVSVLRAWPPDGDGERLRVAFAATDGERSGSIDVFVSASRLASLQRAGDDPLAWAEQRLRRLAAMHRWDVDPFASLVEHRHLTLLD
ncbi:MAG: hypothetical protein R3C15_01965 [Thermoleophilia bacterium]